MSSQLVVLGDDSDVEIRRRDDHRPVTYAPNADVVELSSSEA
jgi:hypothetical protein